MEKDFESIIKNADMKKIFESRRARVTEIMKEMKVSAVVFEDSEERRDPSIRYLTGHPSDAALIITADGFSTLVPWDENLAAKKAHADKVIGSVTFKRNNVTAVSECLINGSLNLT